MYFLQHRYLRIVLLASLGTWLVMALYQHPVPNQPLFASHVYAQDVPQTSTPVTATITATVTESMPVSETAVITLTATATPVPTNTTPPTPTATWTAVWVTPTPVAIDLFAAATLSIQMTADATTTGTATPLPVNWKVASVRVLPYVPEPENQATVEALAVEATARAITTGEPAGIIFWTATPRPTNTPAPTNTAPPTPTATWTAVWVTPTPAAIDLFAAATLSAEMTADATTTGTATPLPINWKVAGVRVLPYVPEPENQATVEALAVEATARAFTTGEPAGVVYWTATPRPTNTTAATPTATNTPIVVTATATPADVLIAATLAAQATLDATTTGTATPLSKNVVLATNTPRPIIITSTATPENAATAAVMIAQETAIAFTTGTPDPARYITATPTNTSTPVAVAAAATTRPTNTATPIFIALDALTATPTPNVTPGFPDSLVGKIFFLADMDGRGGPEAYVMEPDGSNVVRLTSTEFYQRAAARDAASADLRYTAFVRKEMSGSRERQIFAQDAFYNSEAQLTYFGAGIAWDPAWSPTAERVAFVSNESGNDEIWVANKDEWPATQLTKNEWAWDKHPSWSPDGAQIVFMSNRNGSQQIWIMQADGSEQRQLTDFAFTAWDPVWVKYTDQ